MSDVLERFAKVLTIFGGVALCEGILFNVFRFIPFSLSLVSVLTISDHLSTAATHLTILILSAVAGYILGEVHPISLAPNTEKKPWGWKYRRWKDLWIIGCAVVLFFTQLESLGAVLLVGVVLLWWAEHGERVSLAMLGEEHVITRLCFKFVIYASVVLIFSGYVEGRLLINGPANVRVETDGSQPFDGALIGVFDRGALFLTKPLNQIVFLSPRASLRVVEIASQPSLYWDFRRWRRNIFGGDEHWD